MTFNLMIIKCDFRKEGNFTRLRETYHAFWNADTLRATVRHWFINYTPGIYADGYIVFAFPFVRSYVRSFVRSLVRFFVRNSGTFVEFMSKFWLKFL